MERNQTTPLKKQFFSDSETIDVFLLKVFRGKKVEESSQKEQQIMYNIVNIPLVNTGIKFIKIFGFKISTINEATGFKKTFFQKHTNTS